MHFLLEMSGFSRVSTANELKKIICHPLFTGKIAKYPGSRANHSPTTTPIIPTYHSPQLLPSTLLSATCWEALLGHPWRYVDTGEFWVEENWSTSFVHTLAVFRSAIFSCMQGLHKARNKSMNPRIPLCFSKYFPTWPSHPIETTA